MAIAKSQIQRVAILGAGPIGLEAALRALELQFSVTVYEQGRVGDFVQRWGHVRLFSPFGMNSTPEGKEAIEREFPKHEFPAESDCITGREHLAAYLEPLSKTTSLRECIKTESQIMAVGRRGCLKEDSPGDAKRAAQPFRLLIRDAKGKERAEEADVVLDCTGTYGQPRWLGDGGIPAAGERAARQQISYHIDDILGEKRNHYAGKSVLVLGGGYSAATTVTNLAALAEKHPETWVVWLARGSSSQPIKRLVGDPLKERDRLAVRANTLATRSDANVEFHNQSVIEAIEFLGPDKGFKVSCRCGGKVRQWDVERVVANVGYSPDSGIYRELQVHECYASLGPMALAAALSEHAGKDCLQVPAQGAQTLRNPEPNFFILGSKSYGRSSQFLLKTGFEQVRGVFSLIAAKSSARR